MTLYNAKRTVDGICITKFTDDLDVEETAGRPSSYIVSRMVCGCPAGTRHTCRHREMLPRFEATKRINSPWFWDHDNSLWYYLGEEGKLIPEGMQLELEAKQHVRPVEKKNAKACPAWRRL